MIYRLASFSSDRTVEHRESRADRLTPLNPPFTHSILSENSLVQYHYALIMFCRIGCPYTSERKYGTMQILSGYVSRQVLSVQYKQRYV